MTDIWIIAKMGAKNICHNGNKTTITNLYRGETRQETGRKGEHERSKIPRELCLEVLGSAFT